MRIWMEDALAKLSRKSDTAAAIRYATSRWQALTRYVDDGHLEIDNNAAERALRVVALGRNYVQSIIMRNRLRSCWTEARSVRDQSFCVAR